MTDICTGCHARPRPDEAFICQECGDQWHGDLQAVPGWLDELRIHADLLGIDSWQVLWTPEDES